MPDATIVITTKNRKEELRVALRSAVLQTALPEILVFDDGSTDGTADMVQAEFSGVILHRFDESKGYIVHRNAGASLASGKIIFSIDDDAEFTTPHVVEQTLREFDDPRIGAVAIPYIEPQKDNRLLQQAPNRAQVWITDRFIGTAHALRRDVFLKLGRYREHLVHQGEESDFCLRLLAAGYVVRLGYADPIWHFESPKRDFRRIDFYGARNAILFAWQNVPIPFVVPHLAMTTFNCLRHSLVGHRLRTRLQGVVDGYKQAITGAAARVTVSPAAYRWHRRLKKLSAVPLVEIESALATLNGRQGG